MFSLYTFYVITLIEYLIINFFLWLPSDGTCILLGTITITISTCVLMLSHSRSYSVPLSCVLMLSHSCSYSVPLSCVLMLSHSCSYSVSLMCSYAISFLFLFSASLMCSYAISFLFLFSASLMWCVNRILVTCTVIKWSLVSVRTAELWM